MYRVVMSSCLWMKTTDPSSLHVPPCLSTCSIRRICKKRMPLMADVANTCPFEPTDSTTMDATTTIKSATNRKKKETFTLKEKYLIIHEEDDNIKTLKINFSTLAVNKRNRNRNKNSATGVHVLPPTLQ